MSLITWKEEFYPIPASHYMPWESTCQHSLQKWIGLRPENLQKHNVALRPYQLSNPRPPVYLVDVDIEKLKHDKLDYNWDILEINGSSCALCLKSEHVVLDIQDEQVEEFGMDVEDFIDEDEKCIEMCDVCPINHLLYMPCDADPECDDEDDMKTYPKKLHGVTKKRQQSPFRIFTETYNPEPMIAVLEDAVKLFQERPKEFFVSINLKKGFLNNEISPLTVEDIEEFVKQTSDAFKVDATKLITLQRERAEYILEMCQKKLQQYKALDPDTNMLLADLYKKQIEYCKNRIAETQAELDCINSALQDKA